MLFQAALLHTIGSYLDLFSGQPADRRSWACRADQGRSWEQWTLVAPRQALGTQHPWQTTTLIFWLVITAMRGCAGKRISEIVFQRWMKHYLISTWMHYNLMTINWGRALNAYWATFLRKSDVYANKSPTDAGRAVYVFRLLYKHNIFWIMVEQI